MTPSTRYDRRLHTDAVTPASTHTGSDDIFVILVVYVDGILITGTEENMAKRLKKARTDRSAMTRHGCGQSHPRHSGHSQP